MLRLFSVLFSICLSSPSIALQGDDVRRYTTGGGGCYNSDGSQSSQQRRGIDACLDAGGRVIGAFDTDINGVLGCTVQCQM